MPMVKCSYCNKRFYRDNRRTNESIKFGWKSYCSNKCQSSSKNIQKSLICSRVGCNNFFLRKRAEFSKSQLHFCSHRCSALVNNSKRPIKPPKAKICLFCGENYIGYGVKYCSTSCKSKGSIVDETEITSWIKNFYFENGRIPFKREYGHYHAAQSRFATWNKAVETAGFDPNPAMFAKHYVANDGHKCDSLSEKIIDDWLYRRKIKHEIHFPYPEDRGFSCDFKVNNYWIEFFGLSGELKRYDELKAKKLNLARKYSLNLIQIYPNDLFPKSNLNILLSRLIN